MTKNQFKQITDHIWKVRKSFHTLAQQGLDFSFGYPDYAGLPNRIAKILSPEAVDAMQSIWSQVTSLNIYGESLSWRGTYRIVHCKTKREFCSVYKERLKALGEQVK